MAPMRRFSKREQKAYQRSNAVEQIWLVPTSEMLACIREMRKSLRYEDQDNAQIACQSLLDLLCEATGVPSTRVNLKEKANVRFKKGKNGRKRAVWKLFGTCDDHGKITVTFRTAVQGKVFAFRTFLNTLLHEFVHHYDYQKLKLAASFHTKGFYARLGSIYKPLRDSVDEKYAMDA